eukprot:7385849-Prymnesium_polylepis.1
MRTIVDRAPSPHAKPNPKRKGQRAGSGRSPRGLGPDSLRHPGTSTQAIPQIGAPTYERPKCNLNLCEPQPTDSVKPLRTTSTLDLGPGSWGEKRD